jgi:hypothetical protein
LRRGDNGDRQQERLAEPRRADHGPHDRNTGAPQVFSKTSFAGPAPSLEAKLTMRSLHL